MKNILPKFHAFLNRRIDSDTVGELLVAAATMIGFFLWFAFLF